MKIKTSIFLILFQCVFVFFSITFGVYALTQAQIIVAGSLGYEKHMSQGVMFVKDDSYKSSGYGTIEYQIDENGSWVNLIQDGELSLNISDVYKL